MWVAKMEMARTCEHGETTIFGDSRPMAGLIPDHMGRGTVNLSLGGGTPIEFAYLVEQILKCPSLPKRVIVSFPPLHLMEVDAYWERSVLFGFLTFSQMEEVRRISRRLNDKLIYTGKSSDFVLNYSYSVSLPAYYFPAMVNGWFVARKEKNSMEMNAVLRSGGHRLFGTAPGSDWYGKEAWLGRFKPAPVLDYYFDKGIALLNKHGIPTYFVSMPLNDVTFRAMRADLHGDFANYLARYSERYGTFQVLGEVLSSLPGKYFGDPAHLNMAGAKMWSDLVANRVQEASMRENHKAP
jgi:hypothetical protein